MKLAISLENKLDVEKLVSLVSQIVEGHLKEEGSLDDSLLVISVAKSVEGQLAT